MIRTILLGLGIATGCADLVLATPPTSQERDGPWSNAQEGWRAVGSSRFGYTALSGLADAIGEMGPSYDELRANIRVECDEVTLIFTIPPNLQDVSVDEEFTRHHVLIAEWVGEEIEDSSVYLGRIRHGSQLMYVSGGDEIVAKIVRAEMLTTTFTWTGGEPFGFKWNLTNAPLSIVQSCAD